MARRTRGKTPTGPPERPELTKPVAEAQRLLQEQIQKGTELLKRPMQSRDELGAVRRAFRNWEDYNKELLRRLFTTDELSDEFGAAVRMVYSLGESSLPEDISEFQSDSRARLRRLESISARVPLLAPDALEPAPSARAQTPPRRVFIVHGRDRGPREAIRNFLRVLDIEPVVLEEQPNQGRTLIEKFEANIDVSFAVVILTPDDIGAPKEGLDNARPRARQNVILELGYFIGLLGRRNVAPIKAGDLDVPSDVDGIAYIDFDRGGAWKLQLGKELKAAGIDVDLNRAV